MKIEVIVAVSKQKTGSLGIGFNDKLPWNCHEELILFKEKTIGNILIMGRKTIENIPKLSNRTIYCISKSLPPLENRTVGRNTVKVFSQLVDAIVFAQLNEKGKIIFIAGGEKIYALAFSHYQNNINKLHISYIHKEYECNKYFPYVPSRYMCKCESVEEYKDFTHQVLNLSGGNLSEVMYLDLLYKISCKGLLRPCRNGVVMSMFSPDTLKFDLSRGFPLLTTKKMFFKGIVEELLFFIRGDTNTKHLEEKGINIWKGNTSTDFLKQQNLNYIEGEMGPMYGYQWRKFNGELDQLSELIELIKTDPYSRRLLLTDYNPLQARQGVLYPCHSIIIQFYVIDNYLEAKVFNRSSDLFLGLPFNIASSALLLILIAKITNLNPGYLYLDLGDAHIYKQHIEYVKEQLTRIPYNFPKLKISKEVKTLSDIENLCYKDFELEGYKCYTPLKAEMVP